MNTSEWNVSFNFGNYLQIAKLKSEFTATIWYNIISVSDPVYKLLHTERVLHVAMYVSKICIYTGCLLPSFIQLVQEYPHVSRALRDMHYRRTGKSAKELDYRGYHFCSMALSYNTGHPDLDAFTRERCPLIFEIELLKVEQPGDYKMDHWAMTDYDKKRAVPKLKEEGNKLYEEGEYAKAAELYFEALCYVEEQLMEYRRDSPSWNSQIEIKVPLLLNYSQCKLLLKEYVETIRHCSTVIEYEPKNVKAYFRRAKAYAAQWDEKEARADFAKAVELDPSLAKAAEKELKAMTERLKEKDKEERERLKGKLFS